MTGPATWGYHGLRMVYSWSLATTWKWKGQLQANDINFWSPFAIRPGFSHEGSLKRPWKRPTRHWPKTPAAAVHQPVFQVDRGRSKSHLNRLKISHLWGPSSYIPFSGWWLVAINFIFPLISRANALVPPTPLGEGLKPGMVHVGVGQLATWCDPALASRFPT